MVTFVNTALYKAMYKILYLFIMKILEMYLVPGTASSCFVVIALFWLLSAKGKKILWKQYYNTSFTASTPNITNIHVTNTNYNIIKTFREYWSGT